MNENLPGAFQAIPADVVYSLASYVATLATPEERGGAAQLLAYIVRMRDPRRAQMVLEKMEKR